MLNNPMNSSITKNIKIDELSIRKWIMDGNVSYDINGRNKKIVIIVGKSNIEKELDNLKLPAVIDDAIVIDLRENCKDKRDAERLEDFILTRTDFKNKLVTGFLVDEGCSSLDEYRSVYVKTIQSVVGGNLKTILSLDVNDMNTINGLLALMAVNVIATGRDLDTRIAIAQNLTIGEPIHNNKYERILNGRELYNIDDLVEILKDLEGVSIRVRKITKDVFYSVIGGSVFLKHRLNAIAGMEVPAVWLALVNTYTTDRLYAKSQLFYRIDAIKKMVQLEEFNTSINLTYKSYMKNNETLID